MVFVGLAEHRGRVLTPESMTMGPERSKPRHNFTRHLRCMKVTSDGADAPSAGDRQSPAMSFENSAVTRKRELEGEIKQQFPLSGRATGKRKRISKSRIGGGDREDGIKVVSEKLMFDLKTAADEMKDAIMRKEAGEDGNGVDEKEQQEPTAAPAPSSAAAAAVEPRRWNLRPRRITTYKALIADGSGKCLKIEEKILNHSPPRTDLANGAKLRPKSKASLETPQRLNISVPLSKKEIEQDFMDLFGHGPPRRPKKRPRNVQKALDAVFPGLCLSDITLDTYKVRKNP